MSLRVRSVLRFFGLAAVFVLLMQTVSCKKKLNYLWPHPVSNNNIVIRVSVSDTLFSASTLEWTTPEGCLDLPRLSTGPLITCVLHNTGSETVSVPAVGMAVFNGNESGVIHPGHALRLSINSREARHPCERHRGGGFMCWPRSQSVEFTDIKSGDSLIFSDMVNPLLEFDVRPVDVGVYEVFAELQNPYWSAEDPTMWVGSSISNRVTFRVED